MKTRRETVTLGLLGASTVLAPPVAALIPMPRSRPVFPALDVVSETWYKVAQAAFQARSKPIVYGKLNYQNIPGEGGEREVNGTPCRWLPAVHGDGRRDDAPGLNAILADRCCERLEDRSLSLFKAHSCPTLPADRLYCIHSPIVTPGALNFSPPGYKFQTVWFPHHHPDGDLSSDFEPGEVRLFWFDFAEGDPERDTALRVISVKAEAPVS